METVFYQKLSCLEKKILTTKKTVKVKSKKLPILKHEMLLSLNK